VAGDHGRAAFARAMVVEDEARIASFLRKGLTASGFATEVAADGGQALRLLESREFALAEMFFRHPGQVLSREQLLSRVWGYDFDPGSNVVDVYVGYLRRKLGRQRITSVRGMGYRLEPGGA
jgi:two-component system, OmpR family, copper resistance phosphate regulon response regulator CusR